MERSPSDSGTAAELAWRDDLTGAWNRRYLRRMLDQEWPRLTGAHPTFTLLVLDLDGFKRVNDSFGHAAGDRVLRWAADELRDGFRDGDDLIRYGGDEFVIALPDVGAEEATRLAERARSGFHSVSVDDPANGTAVEVPISFSLGVATFPEDGARGEELLAVADRRLYEEKRQRRPATEAGSSSPSRRLGWVMAAVAALLVATLAAIVSLRAVRRPPEPPAADLGTGGVGAASAAAPTVPDNEIVVRDEEELAALRVEVERLRAALEEERADKAREAYSERIRTLEEQLATAEREAVVEPVVASTDVEAATGLRVGERRTREELLPEGGAPADAATVATPAPAPASAAAAPVAAEPVVVLPRLRQAPRVSYPPLARNRRRAATVELLLTVDATGRVVAAEPTGPAAGFGFDEAARSAGLSAQFAPGTRDGVAVEMQTRLAIRFRLEEPNRR